MRLSLGSAAAEALRLAGGVEALGWVGPGGLKWRMAGSCSGRAAGRRGRRRAALPTASGLAGAVRELGEGQVPLPVSVPHLRVVPESRGWRRLRELRVVPVGVGVAERAQRLEAAPGAGAQAAGLATLLEPLL